MPKNKNIMKKLVAILCFVLFSFSAFTQDIEGKWNGNLEVSSNPVIPKILILTIAVKVWEWLNRNIPFVSSEEEPGFTACLAANQLANALLRGLTPAHKGLYSCCIGIRKEFMNPTHFTLWNIMVSSLLDAHAGHTRYKKIGRKVLNLNDITFNKRLAINLIGRCFEIPYISYCQPLWLVWNNIAQKIKGLQENQKK